MGDVVLDDEVERAGEAAEKDFVLVDEAGVSYFFWDRLS